MKKKKFLGLISLIILFIVVVSLGIFFILNNENKVEETTQDTNSIPGFPSSIEPREGKIKLEEVEKHDNEADCWIIFDGDVYDITSYISKHPGGKTALIPLCGTDETFETAFLGQHGTGMIDDLKKEVLLQGEIE